MTSSGGYGIFFCSRKVSGIMGSIIELVDKVENLSPERKKLFHTIFRVWRYVGELRVPPSFRRKVKEYYGEKGEDVTCAIERIRTQTIVKTFNVWTGEAALFNRLRAGRPGQKTKQPVEGKERLFAYIKEAEEDCDFCNPEISTPEDVFGRVRGKHCITAANIAKYDAYNGVVVFDQHNPLEFSQKQLSDYIDVGMEWCRKVNRYDRNLKYPFFAWNCLGKAGASQVHGHAQVLVARDMPYAKVQTLFHAADRYGKETTGDYFDALFKAHESVGLASRDRETGLLAYLSPVKEKELMMIASSINDDLKVTIFKVLRCCIDEMGVVSFNMSITMPSIDGEGDGLPIITRIVDRGDIFKPTSDFGGMELYGTNVIGSDPYTVFETVRKPIPST